MLLFWYTLLGHCSYELLHYKYCFQIHNRYKKGDVFGKISMHAVSIRFTNFEAPHLPEQLYQWFIW